MERERDKKLSSLLPDHVRYIRYITPRLARNALVSVKNKTKAKFLSHIKANLSTDNYEHIYKVQSKISNFTKTHVLPKFYMSRL